MLDISARGNQNLFIAEKAYNRQIEDIIVQITKELRDRLGKAKEKADRTVDQINQYQQDLSRQADTVFDDQAARQLEAERRAGNGGG